MVEQPHRLARELPPLIVLLGPTAVGKTALSLDLCSKYNGEIVSADSRQIYRQMDVGTAKPTCDEQQLVPHHLVDICDPDAIFTVAEYQRLAYAAISEIHRRGRVPFLVGGTALYVRAVVEGLRIPQVPPNPELRRELEQLLACAGREALFQRLAVVDPATAAVIDKQNPRRVLRALEIVLVTGRSKVEIEGAKPPPYRILKIGLDRPRGILYARVDERVDAMIEQGLVEETRRLLEKGYAPNQPAMTGLGYREIGAFLRSEMSLAEAAERIKTETHRFVRHQYTWFRKMRGVQWYDLEDEQSPVVIRSAIAAFLNNAC